MTEYTGARYGNDDHTECWYDMCKETALLGFAYCPMHEMVYRSDHAGSSAEVLLSELTSWEEARDAERRK